MKRMSKLFVLMLALIMALTLGLSACGSNGGSGGQNPVMNFAGNYTCDRANIFIAAEGEDGASAFVTWGSSVSEESSWSMSGKFDADKMTFEYSDCARTDYVYDENGEVKSEENVYMNGHGTITFVEGDPVTLTWKDDQENVADGMVFEYTGVVPDDEDDEIANPWSTADTLHAAAEGAGLDGFSIPEEAEISLGAVKLAEARYMEGIAEANVEFPAVEMTIRKGTAAASEDGDISGDYNVYKNTWTQNIKGLEVTCFGNREGEATKTIWQVDDTCYSITAYGLGGDTDYGLSPDDLNSLINGIQ